MRSNEIIFSFLIGFITFSVYRCDKWSYENQDTWPGYCNGSNQSPVAITKQNVVLDRSLRPLHFYAYGVQLRTATLENDGHTLRLKFGKSHPWPGISSGPLGSKYNFVQMHFHWGSDDTTGSEHTIGKSHYPAELHLVHIKDGLTKEQALSDPEGYAVLAVFFEIFDVDDNPALDFITDSLKHIMEPQTYDSRVPVAVLRRFIPPDTSNYYTYNGSFTTPDCNEVTKWIIFVDTHYISSRQLSEFRSLFTGEQFANGTQKNLLENFRKTQSLNDRKIRVRKPLLYELPSASFTIAVHQSIFIAITFICFFANMQFSSFPDLFTYST